MNKGRIIFLNGVTSAGKTSIVEALQDREDVFFYVVANDLFQEMVGERWLRQDYWKELAQVVLLMYRTAKLLSDEGRDVLIDGILVERPQFGGHLQKLMDIMKDSPLDIVEVACPLDICRARNIARGDRYETQSEEQASLMARDIPYTLRVDTDLHTPAECAEQIVSALMKAKAPAVTRITDPDEKARIAAQILANLPDWFGIPESTAAYVDGCRTMPFWAAVEDGRPVGFIALKETGPHAAEIYVMGVVKERHGHGTGTALWEAFRDYARAHGYEYAQVKTVRRGCYETYDRTNDFYEHLGFRALECFPTLWDEANPCQIYVRSIG